MKEKFAIASIKSVKSSPFKVMKVTKNIVGLKASEAIKLLNFSKLGIASIVKIVIYSAIANAENNHNMNIDNLRIKDIEVGKSFVLKRFATRGRGKSTTILKTYSRFQVQLVEEKNNI